MYSGLHAGHRVVTIRYPDWAIYGKAMQTLAGNSAYQKHLTETAAVLHLEGRTVLAGLDV